VTAGLVAPTLRAALVFSSGRTAGAALSARAVAHAEGVLRAMFLSRVKIAALLLLLAGVLAAGGVITRQALEAAPPGEVEDEGQDMPRRRDAKETPQRQGVTVVKPLPGGLGKQARQDGTIEASERDDVFAVVSGVLRGPVVDIGSRVKKGQLLAEIEAPLL